MQDKLCLSRAACLVDPYKHQPVSSLGLVNLYIVQVQCIAHVTMSSPVGLTNVQLLHLRFDLYIVQLYCIACLTAPTPVGTDKCACGSHLGFAHSTGNLRLPFPTDNLMHTVQTMQLHWGNA